MKFELVDAEKVSTKPPPVVTHRRDLDAEKLLRWHWQKCRHHRACPRCREERARRRAAPERFGANAAGFRFALLTTMCSAP